MLDTLADIVKAAQDGDKDAFGSIVRRFQDVAYGRAYAWLKDHAKAEDAAQDAFVDAYLHLGQLREPAAFPGWFGRVVVKHADRQRRSIKPIVQLDDVTGLASPGPDALETLQHQEVIEVVQQKIASLSQDHREAVTLFHLEGHTQGEIAAFLDIPVSTVKKRLFDARKQLKRRMVKMAPEAKEKRPSEDEAFERRVQFFIAIRTRDFETLESLLAKDPSLAKATSDPDTTPETYGLREVTALFWAVQTADFELLEFLLEKGADANATVRSKDTPLHQAVMMGEYKMAERLIDAGADVQLLAMCGQTVLHRAAIAGEVRLVELLVSNGADLEAEDERGWTAADWAAQKSRRDVLDYLIKNGSPEARVDFAASGSYLIQESEPGGLLGRFIDAEGRPVDGQGVIEDTTIHPCDRFGERGPVWETGIKPVDLFAPIKRGGTFGKEFCLGVGSMLLSGQMIYNFVTRDNARVVYIVAPEGPSSLTVREYWYGTSNAFRNGVVFVVADPKNTNDRLQATVAKGFQLANEFRDAGYDVLVKLQGRLFPHADLASLNRGADDSGSLTTLITGDPPNGIADADMDFDSVIHMSPHLASQGLYPAIDNEFSWSSLLKDETFDEDHRETVAEVKRLLYQYLHFNLNSIAKGKATLYMDDGDVTSQRMRQSRRLTMFLTQTYHGCLTTIRIPA